MNALQNHRRQRKTLPSLEDLEWKVAPAMVSGTAHLGALLQVEARHVDRWEARLEVTTPGSREQAVLVKAIDRTEGRMAVQKARLLAQLQAHPFVAVQAVTATPAATTTSIMTNLALAPFSANPIVALPSATSSASTSTSASSTTQSTTASANSQGSLPANVSETLDVIYNAYVQNPSSFPAGIPTTNGANLVVVQGSNVGLQVFDATPGDLSTLESELQTAGMQITDSSATYGTVVGMLPVSDLPAVAALSDVSSIAPEMQPSAK